MNVQVLSWIARTGNGDRMNLLVSHSKLQRLVPQHSFISKRTSCSTARQASCGSKANRGALSCTSGHFTAAAAILSVGLFCQQPPAAATCLVEVPAPFPLHARREQPGRMCSLMLCIARRNLLLRMHNHWREQERPLHARLQY